MPIEFSCPGCSKVLRTPDTSAGKQAKCPQCGTVVTIPSPDADPLGDPLGDLSSLPSDWGTSSSSPFSGDAGQATSKPVNPYAAPAMGTTYGTGSRSSGAKRKGLPWEREGKSFGSFFATVMMVIKTPNLAYNTMQREGGFGTPLVYALIGGFVGAMATAIYNSILQAGLLGIAGANGAGGEELAVGFGVQIVVQLMIGLLGGTIGIVIGTFISSGIYHLCLMVLGATKLPHQTFETTLRVVAYTTGTWSLLQLIPFCGAYAYGLVALVYTIIGFKEAHEITTGKAVLAVLLPVILCFAVAAVIGVAVVGMIAAGAAATAQ